MGSRAATSAPPEASFSVDDRRRRSSSPSPDRSLGQWLAWQSALHPEAIVPGLDRVRPVAQTLGLETRAASIEEPKGKSDDALPIRIVIAGTNGKGSCAAFLEAMLSKAGLSVGVYTSPHLLRYNERVRIRGEAVGDADLIEAFERVDAARFEVPLTFFEFGTLAAVDLIERSRVDISILEVGLGGRLDAVNLFDSSIALITSIDLDHCEWLGDDRESIGREKAGILRPKTPCIIGDRNPPRSVLERAQALTAPCSLLGSDFEPVRSQGSLRGELGESWHWQDAAGVSLADLPPPGLSGGHQLDNAAACVALMRILAPILPIEPAILPDAIRQGIACACVPGRQQIIDLPAAIETGRRADSTRYSSASKASSLRSVATESPDKPDKGVIRLMVDVAHNPQAVRALADRLAARSSERDIEISKEGISLPSAKPANGGGRRPTRRAVCGILADKDAAAMLECLAPAIDLWYAASLDGPRGRLGRSLLDALPEGAKGRAFDSVEAAIEAALAESKEDDEIVAFGSFMTVMRVLRFAAPDSCRAPDPCREI